MEIKEFLELMDDPDLISTGSSSAPVNTDFEIKPTDFLEFAENDLMSDYSHKDINALSNGKRALDCQLDSLLVAFNLYSVAQRHRWSFPKKVEVVNDLGIVAPRVLKKINKIRNLMEHEFARPNSEQISDFIDIAALFFAATDKYIYNLMYYSTFQIIRGRDSENWKFYCEGTIQLDLEKVIIDLALYKDGTRQEIQQIEVKNDDKDYIKLLAKYLTFAMKY